MESTRWVIFRESRTTGCVFGDGADTRKTETKIVIVPESLEDDYHEACVLEYESQDYSYKFSTRRLCVLDNYEILQLFGRWVKTFETSDFVFFKKDVEDIANPYNQQYKIC